MSTLLPTHEHSRHMNIFEHIVTLLQKGESFVLATILNRSGSAPRAAGTRMIVRSDGSIIGTVGGGILEAEVQSMAGNLFRDKKTLVRKFVLTAEDACRMGMICGGDVLLLLHWVDASDRAPAKLYGEIAETLKSRKRCWLITGLPSVAESPDPPEQRLIRSDEAAFSGFDGHAPISSMMELTAKADSRQPELVWHEERRFLVEPLCREGTVFIFGAGHVSQQLAPLTKLVGFRTVVLDDRQEFANRQRFGSADEVVVHDSFDTVFEGLEIDEECYLVLVTRGHAHDKTVLRRALETSAGYIGMIGSRRKRDSIYRDLMGEGIDARAFERVHSPIGLDIGAETPEEIAVSIVAELIQARAQRTDR